MQDRDTYLREVAEWKATYAQLSERHRLRVCTISDRASTN